MKKILGIILLLSLGLNVNAQLLWKISGKGLEKPSYIFGTHHLAPISIKDSIASMPQAISETAQVYGEVIMSEMTTPAFMQEMQKSMMLPADTTLQSLFTSEQYELLGKTIKENMKVDIAMLGKLKPAAINLQLTVLFCMKYLKDFNPQEQIDTYFQQQALQSGKKVGGLETAQSQMKVLFGSQSLQRQANLLYCVANNVEKTIRQNKEAIDSYKAQDIDRLFLLMEEREGNSCDPLPGEMEALLDNRNKAWIAQMPAIMKGAPTLFVVGAGHLPSKNGVLNLLKQEGYTVTPMK